MASGPIGARHPSPHTLQLLDGRVRWTEARGAFKVRPLLLSELEALGLSGLKVQEQALREFTEAELFHTMSIQNRFSVWSRWRWNHSKGHLCLQYTALWAAGRCRPINPGAWTGERLFTRPPPSVEAGYTPRRQNSKAGSWYLLSSDGLLRFTALVLISASNFSTDRVLGRL